MGFNLLRIYLRLPILEKVKSYYLILLVLFGYSTFSLGHEHAIFYKASQAETNDQYQAYCKLNFGRVYFSRGGTTTISTTNFDHRSDKTIFREVFQLKWNVQNASPITFQGNPIDKYTYITSGNSTVNTVYGYNSIASDLGSTGITERWITEQDQLAFELLGKGTAPWKTLRFSIKGIETSLTEVGIRAKGKLGTVLITSPITRVKRRGTWQKVASAFTKFADGQYGITFLKELSKYDSVWVDPRLVFSGYSGSTADNWGTSATYNLAGETFLTGIAFSEGFPTTLGAYQPRYESTQRGDFTTDVSIQRFSADGSRLLACTYLGGNSQDVAHSVVCNSRGQLIVFGTTGSNTFPITANAPQLSFRGGTSLNPFNLGGINQGFLSYPRGSDFFISVLSPNLDSLINSTYWGGTANEGINVCTSGYTANYGDQFRGTVDVDSANNIYISGLSFSANFPVQGGFQTQYGGNGDGVLCKFSPSLLPLYSTFVGGAGFDLLNSVTVSSIGRVGFCGASASTNLLTTRGCYQPNPTTTGGAGYGNFDAIAGVLTTSLNLSFLTYSGTSGYDQAYFADFDAQQNLYIMGQTTGNMPFLPVGTSGSPTGGLFIQRFTQNGGSLSLAYRFGSRTNTPNISPTAFQVDTCGQIYFSGWGGSLSANNCTYINTGTSGLQVSSDGYRRSTDGVDFYVCVLTPEAAEIKYATFFGSNAEAVEHVDGGTSRFDPRGYIYQAVCAGCGGRSTFPTTPNVYSRFNLSNNCNQAAFKIDLTPLYLPVLASISPDPVCQNRTLILTHNARPFNGGYIDFGDGTQINVRRSPVLHTYSSPGSYQIRVKGLGPACPNVDSVQIPVTVKAGVLAPYDTLFSYCSLDTFPINLEPTPYQVQWYPSQFLSVDTGTNVLASPPSSILYTLVYSNRESGCADTTTVFLTSVSVQTRPVIRIKIDSCLGITTARLAPSVSADTTRWIINKQVIEDDTLFQVYTRSVIDSITLFQSVNGCNATRTELLSIRVKKVDVPLDYTSDSLLVDCNNLRYTLSLKDSASEALWSRGQQIFANTKTWKIDPSVESGYIQLRVNRLGCLDSTSFLYTPQKPSVPNLLTSNLDGKNDRFQPLNLPPTAKLSIYDRWGKNVVIDIPAKDGFSFSDRGAGVYFYTIKDPSAGTCRGWIEVLK